MDQTWIDGKRAEYEAEQRRLRGLLAQAEEAAANLRAGILRSEGALLALGEVEAALRGPDAADPQDEAGRQP
jgi:hypothetical protein